MKRLKEKLAKLAGFRYVISKSVEGFGTWELGDHWVWIHPDWVYGSNNEKN